LKISKMSKSGLEVTELCYGTLTLGVLQANLPTEDGAKAIRKALELGVNFIDTAQRYDSYRHVGEALKGWKGDVIVASKSFEKTYDGMKNTVIEALQMMNIERIGIFHLHLITSKQDLQSREGALKCLVDLRRDGVIGAIGVSAHSAEGVMAVVDCDDIDVVFPIVNMKGFGIVSGTLDDMLNAVKVAKSKGKDLYAMKPLGGGHFIRQIPEAISFIRSLGIFDSISVGMKTPDEVEMNVSIFEKGYVPEEIARKIKITKKRLIVYDSCKRCGNCEETCDQGAIKVGEKKAVVDHEKCILCGYCASQCPVFALRVI